jgi:predicted component of type VI protein secretion system
MDEQAVTTIRDASGDENASELVPSGKSALQRLLECEPNESSTRSGVARGIQLDIPTTADIENLLNQERMNQFKSEFEERFLEALRESEFEYGFSSLADFFIQRRLDENEAVTREWLNDIFIRHFADVAISTSILRVIAHVDYDKIYPEGVTIALAALAHCNVEVKECGVRAFENWEIPEHLPLLENLEFEEAWLNEYVQRVITEIKEFSTYAAAR